MISLFENMLRGDCLCFCIKASKCIIKEPRFNLMYDKFRFYQRQKIYVRSFFGKMEIFLPSLGRVFFFFSLPKGLFSAFDFSIRVTSVKSFHMGILSST